MRNLILRVFALVTFIAPSAFGKLQTKIDKSFDLDKEFVNSLTAEQQEYLFESIVKAGMVEVPKLDTEDNSYKFYDVDRIEKSACQGVQSGGNTDPDKF